MRTIGIIMMQQNRWGWLTGLLLALCLSGCATHRGAIDEVSAMGTRQKFDYFYLEAERLKAIGQDDAAFDAMRRAIEIDTTSAAARFFIAPYYLSLGEYEQAQRDLHYAAESSPDNYWYNIVYANFSQRVGSSSEAVRVWERLLEQNLDKPELNSALADAYVDQGDIPEAIACYNRMEESMGFSESISIAKMRLYEALGNDSLIIDEAQKLQRTYPQNSDYIKLLGDIYLATNRDSLALSTYNHALSVDSENGYVYLSKADYYEKQGDSIAYNNEIRNALLHKNIDVNTKMGIFRTYIVDLMQKNRELSRVDTLFTEMIELYPQEEPIRNLYGMYLSSREDYACAEEQYLIATDLAPTHVENWLQLIGLYLYQEKYDDVINVGKRAIQYIPEEEDIYMYVAMAGMAQKEYDEAVALLEKGLAHVHKEDGAVLSTFYGQLGDVYHAAGDTIQAYAMYEKALSHNPSNVLVLNNYSYFLALAGKDLNRAERMSAQAVKAEPDNATYLDTYAWVFFKQGNYSLARLYLQNALDKTDNPGTEMYEHYGDILIMLGEEDEALLYWQKALDAGSEWPELLKKKIENKKYIEQ